MKKLPIICSAALIAISLLSAFPSLAANNGTGNNGNSGNGNGNNGNGNGNGASLPINKGLVALLIAGTVFGILVVKKATKTITTDKV